MKSVFAIIAAVCLCGCASTSGIYTKGDQSLEVKSTRFMWVSESAKIVLGVNGPEMELGATKTDTEAITATGNTLGALMGAAIKAAGTGVK